MPPRLTPVWREHSAIYPLGLGSARLGSRQLRGVSLVLECKLQSLFD